MIHPPSHVTAAHVAAFKEVQDLFKKQQQFADSTTPLEDLLNSAQVVTFNGEHYLVFPQIRVIGSKIDSIARHFGKGHSPNGH